MLAYIFTFLITSIIALFKNKKNATIVSILLIIILTLFAGTREAGIDNDYNEYVRLFESSVVQGHQVSYELIFYILPNILANLTYDHYIEITFIIFAFFGVSTKIRMLNKYSVNFFLSILIYICVFYLGSEFTTIRAGVASGIFLLMLNDIIKNNKSSYFIKLGVALIFHYSSLLFIPIWFILKSKLSLKYYYLGLSIAFIFMFINFDILSIINIDEYIPKMKVYTSTEDEISLNPFNFKMLLSLLYLVIFSYFYKKGNKDEMFVLLLKIHIISLIVFYLLAQSSIAFSLRSFELLSIVQILLIPYLVKFLPLKLKLFGYFLVIITSLINFYYILFMTNIIKDYSSWLF